MAPATRPATRPAGGAAARPAPPPAADKDRILTMEEIRQLYDDGRYADVIKAMGRVLQLKGKAAEPYDRYELFVLKAETHLRTKAQVAAIQALTSAVEETEDPQKIAVAKATVILLKRSKNFAYSSAPRKGVKSVSHDVIDPESRKAALRALLADEMAAAAPKVDAALDGRSLAPIAAALQAIQGLDVLEQAVGDEGESRQLVQELKDRGNAMMAKALQKLSRRVDEIQKSANEIVTIRVIVPQADGTSREETQSRKRGLTREDRTDLKAVIDTCAQLAPNARGLAQATGGKAEEADPIIDAAEELARKTDRVLKADYSAL